MARLTALFIQKCRKPGKYGDGNNLYLQIAKTGSKSWIMRYMIDGRPREMGLGPVDLVSLREAREKCHASRRLLYDGFDPIEVRSKNKQDALAIAEKSVSFDECAAQYIRSKQSEWKNQKHVEQWSSTLKAYASPVFGTLPVHAIDTALVLKALQPIWTEKCETASRVRGRIEAVLSYASAKGLRSIENPARWRGHLNAILPMTTKIKPVRHMPALPWQDIPEFMSELRTKISITSRALELLVLTALRPGELVAARSSEFDFQQMVWTIPAERMKIPRIHKIPMTPRMASIVKPLNAKGSFIFPGIRSNHLTTNSLLNLVKGMRPNMEITSHGFRSAFKDWASESTTFPREVIEMCLAHSIGDKVEAAYRRGDLFEKRKWLMNDWCSYCLAYENQTTNPASLNNVGS